MNILGAYTKFAALRRKLPDLVKEQRTLEARIAPILPDVDREKEVRKEIDALLLKAGVGKSEAVQCDGYDVVHNERAGQERLDQAQLLEQLEAEFKVPRDKGTELLAACTKRDDPAKFATVKPSKGAKVKAV